MTAAAHDRRRPLSEKPDAVRQRASRRKREAGFRSVRLYVPIARIAAAVKRRENLSLDPTEQQIIQVLTEALDWWSQNWINLKRHK